MITSPLTRTATSTVSALPPWSGPCRLTLPPSSALLWLPSGSPLASLIGPQDPAPASTSWVCHGGPTPLLLLGLGFAPHECTCCVHFLPLPRRLPGHLVVGASIVHPRTVRSICSLRGLSPGGLGCSSQQWGRKTC